MGQKADHVFVACRALRRRVIRVGGAIVRRLPEVGGHRQFGQKAVDVGRRPAVALRDDRPPQDPAVLGKQVRGDHEGDTTVKQRREDQGCGARTTEAEDPADDDVGVDREQPRHALTPAVRRRARRARRVSPQRPVAWPALPSARSASPPRRASA